MGKPRKILRRNQSEPLWMGNTIINISDTFHGIPNDQIETTRNINQWHQTTMQGMKRFLEYLETKIGATGGKRKNKAKRLYLHTHTHALPVRQK